MLANICPECSQHASPKSCIAHPSSEGRVQISLPRGRKEDSACKLSPDLVAFPQAAFFRLGEVHRALLGGSRREEEASEAAIWGCVILNMCTDSSSYSLESRNVVLLVSRGTRGPTSELEAEPGTIMESRRRTSVNQRHACLFTVQSAAGKPPQQAHKHIYRDFTARFVRNNKAITQHLRLGALYSMESYPESLGAG